jgi:hypothetical protein
MTTSLWLQYKENAAECKNTATVSGSDRLQMDDFVTLQQKLQFNVLSSAMWNALSILPPVRSAVAVINGDYQLLILLVCQSQSTNCIIYVFTWPCLGSVKSHHQAINESYKMGTLYVNTQMDRNGNPLCKHTNG